MEIKEFGDGGGEWEGTMKGWEWRKVHVWRRGMERASENGNGWEGRRKE